MILLVKEKQKIRYKTNKNDKTQTHKRRLNQINNKKFREYWTAKWNKQDVPGNSASGLKCG